MPSCCQVEVRREVYREHRPLKWFHFYSVSKYFYSQLNFDYRKFTFVFCQKLASILWQNVFVLNFFDRVDRVSITLEICLV